MSDLLLFACAAAAVVATLGWMRSTALARGQTRQIKRSMGIRSRWDDAFDVDDEEMLLDPSLELPERRSIVLFVGDIFDDSRRGRELAAKLKDADLKFKPSEALGLIVVIGMLTYIVAELSFSQGPTISGIIAVAVAILVPWLTMRARRDRRLVIFTKQLPTVAELLSNSLRAGLSLQGAIDLMAREIGGPAGEEFGIVVREARLGGGLDDSLEELEKRMPCGDLRVMNTAIRVQRIAGGNLIKSMAELSRTLIERQRTHEEIRTLVSQAMYLAYMMPALSVLALATLNRTSAGFLNPLFQTVPGWICLAVFLLLQIIGFVLIIRFARIKI